MKRRLILLLFLTLTYADVGSLMRKGNGLYRQEKYEDALKSYRAAQVLEPDNPDIRFNLGAALYKLNKYSEALPEWQLALVSKNKKTKAAATYNMGNASFKSGELESAINFYKLSLSINPNDWQAKQNLEFALKIKEELQKQQKQDTTKQKQKQEQQQPQSQPQMQPQKGAMSKEEAQRILEALKNKEKEAQEQAKRVKPKIDVEKDW
ncbi:MAG: tetratricopeptide repeat protein [candidate division WOR-3 bacterium]